MTVTAGRLADPLVQKINYIDLGITLLTLGVLRLTWILGRNVVRSQMKSQKSRPTSCSCRSPEAVNLSHCPRPARKKPVSRSVPHTKQSSASPSHKRRRQSNSSRIGTYKVQQEASLGLARQAILGHEDDGTFTAGEMHLPATIRSREVVAAVPPLHKHTNIGGQLHNRNKPL
jgi:hypothetical protein